MITLLKSPSSSSWVLPILNFVFMVGLTRFHVRAATADNDNDKTNLWDRIRSGPDAVTNLDLILFFSLIMLGMEILTWITKHLGGK
jgi:hypothetical protein